MSSPLDALVQTIHATLATPPTQFLLTTSIGKGKAFNVCIHTLIPARTSRGSAQVRSWSGSEKMPYGFEASEEEVAEAVRDGMLHIDQGTDSDLGLEDQSNLTLQILVQPYPVEIDLRLDPEPRSTHLLSAAYSLLTHQSTYTSSSKGGSANSDLRDLRAQLVQKDAEISALNAKLASMKATVVRVTASDNKKKMQMSPQKPKPPANASKLQPNQKKRKAVVDEFAGSSDDDEGEEDD
ncbi:hypothetical protein IAU60_001330 [Kwoniella sp. DSM 27419]